MSSWKKVLPGFLPFIVALGIMYAVSFTVGLCIVFWGLYNQKETGIDALTIYEQSVGTLTITATACMHVTYVAVFFLWFRKVRGTSSLELAPQKLRAKDWFELICAGVLLQIVISVLLSLLLPLFPQVQSDYEALLDSMEIGKGLLPLMLTGLIAPVGEELIFRGVTMALLDGSLPFAFVNLMQAVLFGLYHMNVVQFCYAFVLGLCLGLIYHRYHNLKACILLHAAVNISGNIFSLFG
ncbi:MAG: CPBP family intramembrane metalloprotease [Lachnospiraceae bacterium]|nr:CPBP family intramembrane metalloprotease [Lachnospiraceae bacterium]